MLNMQTSRVEAPQREPRIQIQMRRLREKALSLEECVDALESRLERVLGPEPPLSGIEKGGNPEASTAPLCAELRIDADRLEELCTRISSLLGRLEV